MKKINKIINYLEKNRINQRKFSDMLGFAKEYVNRLINGKLKMSLTAAEKIEEVTKGEVTAKELLFPEEVSSNYNGLLKQGDSYVCRRCNKMFEVESDE